MALNAEMVSVLLRMRILIKNEFATTLAVQDPDVIEKCCGYALKSRQPDLAQMAQRLMALAATQVTAAAGAPVLAATAVAVAPAPTRPMVAPILAPPAVPRPELVRAEQPVHGLVASTVPATAASVAVSAPVTAGERSFLELLASDRLERPMRLIYRDTLIAVLDKPQQRCFLRVEASDLQQLRDADMQAIRLEAVSVPSLMRYAQEGASMTWEAFLWLCGTTCSQGVLLPALAPRPGFQLRRWPEMGALSTTLKQARMATLLLQQPYTCAGLADAAVVSTEVAATFLNTAFLCGWLREDVLTPRPTGATQPTTSDQSPRGIIGRIRARLGLSR